MKTWEMIRELMENPHKKFKAKWVSGDEIVAYVKERHCIIGGCYEDVIVVEFWNGNIEILIISNLMKNIKWEEVKEPVTFIDVVRAAKEGNRVGLNFNRFGINCTKWELRDLMIDLGEDFEDEELAEIILNGKWYIED